MLQRVRDSKFYKQFSKVPWYVRLRRRFPSQVPHPYDDDPVLLASGEPVLVDWPEGLRKPVMGIIKDYEPYPHWTKYARFCENNGFAYEVYDIHAHDWQEKARKFDIVIGFVYNEYHMLLEIRRKFYVLETFMGIWCLPSYRYILLYEDKILETYLSHACGLPFAKTYISNDREDALRMVEGLSYPVIHKMVPGSGSIGVELVNNARQARKIVEQAFSAVGRATAMLYFRQKNTVYFQDFIPNDGLDIRVLVTGNQAFGYVRRVMEGDFRASGMHSWEWGELPEGAVRMAFQVNEVVKSPLLVVDMVHGIDGRYTVIEFSPTCQIDSPEQLKINDVGCVYVLGADGGLRFEQRKVWPQELALREFLVTEYLPQAMETHRKPARIDTVFQR